MPFDVIFNIFLDFMRFTLGLHFAVNWGSNSFDFYPFIFIAVAVLTDLTFDLFFPRPKGDD